MVVRILYLLASLIILVNLCLITLCYLTGSNIYQKYGNQILLGVCIFVFVVAALYVTGALLGLGNL